jgi:hypothetical protein
MAYDFEIEGPLRILIGFSVPAFRSEPLYTVTVYAPRANTLAWL